MPRHFAIPVGRLIAASLLVGLTACAEGALPTAESPSFARVNGKNGFSAFAISFPDDMLCSAHGVPVVWTDLDGYLKTSSVQTKPDGGTRVVEVVTNGRVRLSANAKTLESPLSGNAIYDYDANGNLLTITFPGLNGAFTVPGEGKIALETGKLVLDPAQNVIIERGPHDVFGNNPDVAKLCAFLQ